MQIYIDMPVKGQAAESSKEICYKGQIYNCTEEILMVSAKQQFLGWESIKAQVIVENETDSFKALWYGWDSDMDENGGADGCRRA